MIKKYTHPFYKDVYFTISPSVVPEGYTDSGMSGAQYSEEDLISYWVNTDGIYHCYDHHLHLRGSLKCSVQWFRHESELVVPQNERWP